jgi:hypothetical protein
MPPAVALQPLYGGQCAISLGLGAATRASAASVTFPWLIRVLRWIACPPVPRIDHEARINHNNRRASPPAVTPAISCDDCDERGHARVLSALTNKVIGDETGTVSRCAADLRYFGAPTGTGQSPTARSLASPGEPPEPPEPLEQPEPPEQPQPEPRERPEPLLPPEPTAARRRPWPPLAAAAGSRAA